MKNQSAASLQSFESNGKFTPISGAKSPAAADFAKDFSTPSGIEPAKKPTPVLPVSAFVTGEEPASPIHEPECFQHVFLPSWDNKPEEVKPILSLGGTPILTYQNTTMFIASPGLGKSSLCEAAGASYINPLADSLGLHVDPACEGVLIIDNERTVNDVWNSFARMCARAGKKPGDPVGNVKIAGLRAIPRLEERLKTIEYLLSNYPCGLLLIDGLGDLVTDANDLLQAIDCRIWLREITVKYKVSILTTIHPNPNSNKPRGHIGSEGHREAECVLLARPAEGDVRILTTDFEHGKNRNGAHVMAAYRWSEEHKMFVSADADSINLRKNDSGIKKVKAELIATKVLPAPLAKTHTELIEAIRQLENASESTAKRKIADMLHYELIKKHDDGYYRSTI